MISHYYYNRQLKRCAVVFANIFAGLIVKTGLNECGETTDIRVPVRYGSTDRVASAIGAAHTQNQLHTLPMMSVYLTNIDLAPDRQHGIGHLDRRTYLEQGGVYPDDVKAIQRLMPIPYDLTYELGIYASNTDQAYQILEQILILFDYTLQIQMDDAQFNWARQTRVILENINNEEQYPTGAERRQVAWTLSFKFETWFSLPMDIRRDIVQRINLTLGDPAGYGIQEVDENGELRPFDPGSEYSSFQIQAPGAVEPPDPGMEPIELNTGLFNASLEPACPIESPKN